tara:strand:+ start:169 stop:663 length:495 start_codon:yes stop_codon:yes gene_type:complete
MHSIKQLRKINYYPVLLLTLFIVFSSCTNRKKNKEGNHPEIEKLWLEYFENLNGENYSKAVSYLNESVLFSFNSTGIDIEGYEKLESQLKNWKAKVNKEKIYFKVHQLESIKLRKKMTMVDVKLGAYSISSDKLVRELRRYYHFYNSDDIGWKLYMIAGAKVDG